jgi:hypothetical protein
MNSVVSNASAASDNSAAASPTLPTPDHFGSVSGAGRRGSVVGLPGAGGAASRRGRHRRANAGSRNYLGLLEVGKRGSKLDVVVWDEKEGEVGKENKKVVVEEVDEVVEEKKRRGERRSSKDSLGLYDEDGFLISSPVRGGD